MHQTLDIQQVPWQIEICQVLCSRSCGYFDSASVRFSYSNIHTELSDPFHVITYRDCRIKS
jgi:hypothetical protein